MRIKKNLYNLARTGLALFGLLCLGLVLVLFTSENLRKASQFWLFRWDRSEQTAKFEQAPNTTVVCAELIENSKLALTLQCQGVPEAGTTTVKAADLTSPQAEVAKWISRRYSVAVDPLAPFIAEAWKLGAKMNVKPTLLLAVAAIESGFNPIAQSRFGAQGLMQVRTSVHKERYDKYGGLEAVFDPVSNLRVGADILYEYIQRFGSIEKGLNGYVGAAYSGNHGGYASKVLKVYERLNTVAGIDDKASSF